uniref:ATP-dependent RNA helicase n=1 Tax=Rhodosorus marinus TaxID=101924 RepID=A0A7S3EEM7_9RHOD|mmetsp:Transcript_26657/g.103657  ORF Transcript_26657/g.103657 Transcript_26657/m.103657 type:complete len:488 (+) Transcript_26657:454-1917(+)|eukprot:CAMPEP_0113962022 /NCGR_PEP_ID=MMETSP0011_2-20120614/5665_1 /TAXON_ID=101924 /ORGANISM="Rhodosorus marinus" /LENGTH=487 /DNA_ID=CAMNT_0000973791 /DNA_START=310 /DNA_END=1773 /DNA_ORIENTATION=- /assembly_acc=CAM_ASM_000156
MSSSTEVTKESVAGTEEEKEVEKSESKTENGDTAVSEDPEVTAITEGVEQTDVDWAEEDEDEEVEEEEEEVTGIDKGDRTAEVQVLQSNPNTPYYSATTFEELGLSPELMKGLYAMKFNKPSKIQATSLPMIFGKERQNLIGQAHNGSGKTACFVLGMLNQIDFSNPAPQALCVVPTRELARQIHDVIMAIGKFTQVKVYEAVSLPEEERVHSVKIDAHIVVGTPGRVKSCISRRELNTRAIKVFVLDEADQMVDEHNFGEDTVRIKKSLPRDVQTLLFSATYDDVVRALAKRVASDANMITVKREQLSLDSIKQYFFRCQSADARFDVLSEIYASLSLGQSVIFVRKKDTAKSLAAQLRADGHTVSLLYGNPMTPDERDRVVDEFRAGTTKVLLTTNLLARGVDIPQVTVVINYDMPTDKFDQEPEFDTYMHRIGRTGRFGRKGIAINFVYNSFSFRILKEIESFYKHTIEEVKDVEDLEEKIKNI